MDKECFAKESRLVFNTRRMLSADTTNFVPKDIRKTDGARRRGRRDRQERTELPVPQHLPAVLSVPGTCHPRRMPALSESRL